MRCVLHRKLEARTKLIFVSFIYSAYGHFFKLFLYDFTPAVNLDAYVHEGQKEANFLRKIRDLM